MGTGQKGHFLVRDPSQLPCSCVLGRPEPKSGIALPQMPKDSAVPGEWLLSSVHYSSE